MDMAKPIDEAKHAAILSSAIHCINLHGLHATTSAIAKGAGVSAGTLFVYFPDKVTLLNSLYLALKSEIMASLAYAFPAEGTIKVKAFHAWKTYVIWARQHPERRHVLQQLMLSCFITEEAHQKAQAMLKEVHDVLAELGNSRNGNNVAFITSVMTSLAETTIDFVLKAPADENKIIDMGFRMFWQALEISPDQQ
jgi:AcrR family transcriptional regulator